MKRNALRALSAPLLLTLSLFAVSAALLWLAHGARAKAIVERTRAAQAASVERERYRHTAQDEPLIRSTIERFDRMQESGIIGPEKRLDWADHMHALRQKNRLPQLDFELSPQRVLGPISTPAEYSLAASRMEIRAGLVHEGDFFKLMEGLREPLGAIVAPRRCTLTPSGDGTAQSANLRAECTVEWLTVVSTTGARP